MDVVLKISNDYTAATTQAQFINPDELQFTDELVNSGSLGFRLSIGDHQISSILEFKKTALYAISDGADRLLWTGYIDEITNDAQYVSVKCGDEKDFLRNKIIFASKNLSGNLQTVMAGLISEVNARKGINEGDLSFETDVGSTGVGKTFEGGTSYFDIISQICDMLKLEWTVSQNTIKIKTTIGTDRSASGVNFKNFVWNADSPNENNISGFKNTRSSREIATHVFGKASASSSMIIGDKSIFGSIEKSVSMNEGNVAIQTQSYVDTHEVTRIEREIDITVDDESAIDLSVGDIVPVLFVHGSALVDTSENLKIIQRQFIFQNKKPTISVKLASNAKEVASMENFLSDLNRRVKRFELY